MAYTNSFLASILKRLQAYRIQEEAADRATTNSAQAPVKQGNGLMTALAAYGGFKLLRPKQEKPVLGAKPNPEPTEEKVTNANLIGKVKGKPTVFKGSPSRELGGIFDVVEQNRPVKVEHPTSYRFYTRGVDGYVDRESLDEYTGAQKKGIASTCVKSVRYNPSTQACFITFAGGSKEYEFRVPPEEFEAFMEATSKGRHTNYVLKNYYTIPGYTSKNAGRK